jgi:hypothetical protein
MGTKTKTETGVRREQTIVKTLMDRAIEIWTSICFLECRVDDTFPVI